MRYLLLFIGVFLFARLNPFEPVITPQNSVVVKPEYFQKAKVYLPKDARVLKKVIFVYQNINSDIKEKSVVINKDIDFHYPIILIHKPQKTALKSYKITKFLTVYVKNRNIFLKTKNRLIRHFFLVRPFRIILDFKRKSSFPTIKKKISNEFLQKVIVGAHRSFYRVVLVFDTNYKYKISKTQDGVRIECW